MDSPTLKITDDQFQEIIHRYDLVLVDFWAPWCGPCMKLGPVIEQLALYYQGKAVIGKLNIDEHAKMATQYAIKTIPTMLLFHKGIQVERLVGSVPILDIQRVLDGYLAGTADA